MKVIRLIIVGLFALVALAAPTVATEDRMRPQEPLSAERAEDDVVLVGPLSLSQCSAPRFCLWSSTNYTGSFASVIGTGTHPLSVSARSVWNNRSGVARLYNNSGTASICYAPGAMQSSLPSAYHSPSKVVLSISSSC